MKAPHQLTREDKLARWLDKWVPHFSTRDMAMKQIGKSSLYDIVCDMDDVAPGEQHDGIATMKMFVFAGQGYMPTQVGKIRPWVNPNDEKAAA